MATKIIYTRFCTQKKNPQIVFLLQGRRIAPKTLAFYLYILPINRMLAFFGQNHMHVMQLVWPSLETPWFYMGCINLHELM